MKQYLHPYNTLQLQKFISLFVIMLATGAIAHAQVGDPGNNGGGGSGDPGDVLFDGGICLLAAAGISYGIKKSRSIRKAKRQLYES